MHTLAVGPETAPATGSAHEVRTWPAASPRPTTAWVAAPLSMALVSALLTMLLVNNHRYFYVDDRIAETMPKLMDIGRLLRAGEMPWLSTNIVNGGGYAVEYLLSVFNPLHLALAVVLSDVQDVALGAFVYVLAHCLLLTGSAAWLGRRLGLNTAWSIAFAVSVGFQPYTILWNATAWNQGLLAFAWFVLVVAAAVAFHQTPRRRYGWVVLLGTYGCLTSGWPLAVFALGLFVPALLVARQLTGQPVRPTAWLAAWFGGGVGCSLMALYPLLTAFEVADRSSRTGNPDNFNVAPLEGLLHFADPSYYGFFLNFGGYELQTLPHFYVAWFALPVLAFWRVHGFRPSVSPVMVATTVMLAVSAMAALGPERLSVFRYPTRALQFFGFFLLVLVALVVAHGGFCFTRRRLTVALGVLGLLMLNSLQADPEGAARILWFGLAVGALTTACWAQGRRRASDRAAGRWTDTTVVLGTVGVLVALGVLHPAGRGIDTGFPHQIGGLEPVSLQDYTLFYGSYLPPEVDDAAYEHYRPATTGVMVGDRQVNGYSSLGNRHLRRFLPIDDQGDFRPGAAEVFADARDPETGLPFLELLRVDQVVALRGIFDRELRAELDPEVWTRRVTGASTVAYAHQPYALPGLVSYTSPGLGVRPVEGAACDQGSSKECLHVEPAAAGEGKVVFARLWYPGYRATLDGVPVPVVRHAETLVAVVTPPGQGGLLELVYEPPRFRHLAAVAVLLLLGLGVASWRWGPLPQLSSGAVTASSAPGP